MGARSNTIPYRIFIIDRETGETHKWNDLSEAQKNKYKEQMAQNSSEIMSAYYGNHPEQAERLPNSGG